MNTGIQTDGEAPSLPSLSETKEGMVIIDAVVVSELSYSMETCRTST